MWCHCVNPGGHFGCPVCNPHNWIRTENKNCIMWTQKTEKEKKQTMKIFVYRNKKQNSCSGDFYFIAPSRTLADVMAIKFLTDHNAKVNNNLNYTISWDSKNIKEHEIKPGFLPLNRVQINVEK